MGGMPVGDKLKAGQPFRPKSENLPKGEKSTGLGLYASCLGMGIATLKLGGSDVIWLGYALTALGGATTVLDVMRNSNPYKKLFENLKLGVGGQIPRFIRKRVTDYGYCLTFSLPYGMSTDDFRKKQLAIEQYLNKKIEIGYDNYRVFVKVFEKELEKSPLFRIIATKGAREFPIGIRFGGKIITVDLGNEPHLLIAGQTGGGKSTLIRGIITFIILERPRIELYLIDLKGGVEFNVFRKSKNVKVYCRNKEEAEDILSTLLIEADDRLELFYQHNVVDVDEYNKIKGLKKLKYKFVFIDEFSILKKEKNSISAVEELAARARATGIHLILSTQRPDADILNGRIKANIPIAVGLKTLNEVNSRIIIDGKGLEKLRGKGHGLLKYEDVIEFQSFFITNEEARELIKHTYIEKPIKLKVVEKVEEIKEIKDFSFLKKLG